MWTLEEDELLRVAVHHGEARPWANIAKQVSGKTAKQCHSRWLLIGPYRTDDPWTEAECLMLAQLVSVEGRRWAIISQRMLGRTAYDVKNKYNSMVKQGMGPYVAPKTPKVSRERRQKHRHVSVPSTPRAQKVQKKVCGTMKLTIGSSKISLNWDWW